MDGQRRKDARMFTHDAASATDLYDDDDDDDEDDDSVQTLWIGNGVVAEVVQLLLCPPMAR